MTRKINIDIKFVSFTAILALIAATNLYTQDDHWTFGTEFGVWGTYSFNMRMEKALDAKYYATSSFQNISKCADLYDDRGGNRWATGGLVFVPITKSYIFNTFTELCLGFESAKDRLLADSVTLYSGSSGTTNQLSARHQFYTRFTDITSQLHLGFTMGPCNSSSIMWEAISVGIKANYMLSAEFDATESVMDAGFKKVQRSKCIAHNTQIYNFNRFALAPELVFDILWRINVQKYNFILSTGFIFSNMTMTNHCDKNYSDFKLRISIRWAHRKVENCGCINIISS